MLISINWLKDFVEIRESDAKKLASRFTLACAEVEGVETTGEHLRKIRVVEIKSIEKHPEADKLNLVTFDLGTEIKKVVCGAQNVKVGLKVPFAQLGTKLPNGMVLEPKAIRGIMSEGMLCSATELGLSDKADGLMELRADAKLGMQMDEYLGESSDTVLNIDNKSLTHRPDLWGHYGMAREFSAIFNEPLKNRFDAAWESKIKGLIKGGASPVKVRFDGESAGVAYFGLSLDNVKVTESPEWIKKRLLATGLRPINSIVDISNYVMLELGMPLHIFDREKIQGGEVVIKRLGENQKFKTLDEVERDLLAFDTVIADSTGPLVLGGIMGGLSSGVSSSTSKIFIEVANWKPAEVRQTSVRLGLRTDSSSRYEKSLDSQLLLRTLLRTVELVKELSSDATVVGALEYAGVDLSSLKPLVVKTSLSKAQRILGPLVTRESFANILTSLDFKLTDHGDLFDVLVPTYRATKDVECEADIIEELGRVIGYDNISPEAPLVSVAPVALLSAQQLQRKASDFLVNNGKAFEVMTYPLVGEALLKRAQFSLNEELVLVNALSKDHDRMRPSLVPSLLEAASSNQKNLENFKFFEFGRAYKKEAKNFSEEQNHLGVVFQNSDETPFVALTNHLHALLSSLNVPFELVRGDEKFGNDLLPSKWLGIHPFEYLNIKIMGKFHGVIFSVHPLLLREYKIRGHLSMAIVNFSAFDGRPLKDKTKYQPLAKFPSSLFDWTVLAKRETQVEDILKSLKEVKMKEFTSVKVIDIYNREHDKTVTLRATFQDPDKTLDAPTLERGQKLILEATERAGFPLKTE